MTKQWMIPKEIWIVAWCLMVFTNSHIHFDDYLTKISALDTSIYLAIAGASPGVPIDGSNLVFHGAQRLVFPYLIGLMSKFVGISLWSSFQLVVHLCSLVTIFFLNRSLTIIDKSNQNWNSFLICLAIFHPFLFRLQIGFSGFLNDAIFVAGSSIFVFGLLKRSFLFKVFGLLLIIPSKQTIYIIIPLMYFAEIYFSSGAKRHIHYLWIPTAVLTACFYRSISILIGPFSTPDTTSTMAFGFLNWISEIDGMKSFVQLLTFFCRGLLGLFLPFLGLMIVINRNDCMKSSDSQAKLVACFFIAVILQPLISGPSITDASIQRLLSLGLPSLLVLIAILARQRIFIGRSQLLVVTALLFIGSLHHLFSFIGPVLSYRYIFLSLYLLTSFLILVSVFWMKQTITGTNRVPLT